MKKGILIVGGVLIAGAAGAGGWYYFNHMAGGTSSGEDTVYVTTVSSLTGSVAGVTSRFAGVVEPQETVEVKIESGRKVTKVEVKTGQQVKKGELLFEYDLSSIQEDLQEAKLALDRLKNEALSLQDQINTLEAEKKKASADNQLSYTIEIETNKMNLKKNEYDQKSKEAEITKLQNATGNTEVRSEIDGIIQKIDSSKLDNDDGDTLEEGSETYSSSDSDDSGAFITILSTGAYRIKGTVNEQNINSIVEGSSVIIRSRVDENQTWRGTMGAVDRENGKTSSSDMSAYGFFDSSGDSQTSSSTYPFYVELDSSDGLMLGQHVYIENDLGQEDEKDGLWLSDFYIENVDDTDPYVWAVDKNGKLEKREVVLGSYDESLAEYEIVDGLTEDDSIAFPTGELEEGMNTVAGTVDQMMNYQMDYADYGDGVEDVYDIDDWESADDVIDMEDEFDDAAYIEDMDEYEEYDVSDMEDSGDYEMSDMEDWEEMDSFDE
ncbi:MAG: efflux RND transporter periplasmic adaptor subunit [Blautia sp.]|nr:efflux RND transporter periplasmic adaptor subunit [Blautia sp.]